MMILTLIIWYFILVSSSTRPVPLDVRSDSDNLSIQALSGLFIHSYLNFHPIVNFLCFNQKCQHGKPTFVFVIFVFFLNFKALKSYKERGSIVVKICFPFLPLLFVQMRSLSGLLDVSLPVLLPWILIDNLSFFTSGLYYTILNIHPPTLDTSRQSFILYFRFILYYP